MLLCKMNSARSSAWSITINNPVASDEENINTARQRGWKVEGQLEKGENGTPHYQLLVKTPQVRFSALKKQFPRAHIEVCRNITALTQYVHKTETREGELSSQQEQYPSLMKVWDMFAEYIDSQIDYTGSDTDEGLSEWSGVKWLSVFDDYIRDAILKGYVVESIAVNPQVRACVKSYGFQIFMRSIDRQTDRQTPEKIVAGEGITKQNGVEVWDDKVEDQGDRTGCESGYVYKESKKSGF